MTGNKQRNWGKDVYVYSDRKATAGAEHPGCGTKVRCDLLEEKVWKTILSFVNAPDDKVDFAIEQGLNISIEQTRLKDIQQELGHIETAMNRIWNLLSDPDIDELDIREKLKELQQKKKQLQMDQKKILDKNDEPVNLDTEYKRRLLNEAWAVVETTPFSELDFNTKQELIRCIVKEIRVYEQGNIIEVLTL